MGSNLSLVIPAISLAIVALFFMRPGITGFVVAPGGMVSADIKVTTADGVILPEDSIIQISLGERRSSMPISSFIGKSGGQYDLVDGEAPEIGYSGIGYTGNHTYMVPISQFNISREILSGTYRIMVRIIHNGTVISEDVEDVIV